MHPLSTFPQLLTFGLIAPTILRLTVSLFVVSLGLARYKKTYPWASVFYFIISVFLLFGLYTQIASIIALILLGMDYRMEQKVNEVSADQKKLLFIISIILISLLFTGPGFFAFDLPL